jgi:hypothetical protein
MKSKARKDNIIAEDDLGHGRVLRLKKVGNKVYTELLQEGRIVQSNLTGTIKGSTLQIDSFQTEPGDGIKRPPRPCPNWGQPIEHLPDVCTNWLPNGTYGCDHCGLHWLGTVGIVDE